VRKSVRVVVLSVVVSLVAVAMTVVSPPPAHAVVIDASPDQASCDNGSVTHTWTAVGLARPVIASMTVGGETVPDATNPTNGRIGAAICANFADARKVGLIFYRKNGSNLHQDLTGALTPSGNPVTTNTPISVTMTNLGALAEFYSFSLAYGNVSSWTTSGLGTPGASLSFTINPAARVLVTGSGQSAGCSATPPMCNATASDQDILGASIDFDFDQAGTFSAFSGSYFGVVSAVAGFVTRSHSDPEAIEATLGAPHFKADGTTLNVGSMQAFLPSSVLANILGLTGTVGAEDIAVTRSVNSAATDAPFSVTSVAGGVVVRLNDVTFSSPTYTIKKSSGATTPPAKPATKAILESPSGNGYYVIAEDGGVFAFGDAPFHGSMGGQHLNAPVVGAALSNSGNGYLLFAADGGVFAFGDASFQGSMGGRFLAGRVIGGASTSAHGYVLFGADGGVFAFGDARFAGSMGGKHLNAPVIGGASTPSGHGYRLFAADGGVFDFGDAQALGSAAGLRLSAPVVAGIATPSGNGFRLFAADGGVFAFGDAEYAGSMAGRPLAAPIVGAAATASGHGYWLTGADGGVFAFGDAPFNGSGV
jgi:hypothetical protein